MFFLFFSFHALLSSALSDLKSTAVAFKPAKTASLDLAVVLERIKRKADQATVSRDVCEEEEEQGTRVSMEDVEREDDIGDQEDGFMIDTAEDTILPASIPKDILKRLEVSDSIIFTTAFRAALFSALVQNFFPSFFSRKKRNCYYCKTGKMHES